MTFPGISGAPLLINPPSGIKVQDVFNTSLWTGTDAARTITTGINGGEGALVWVKDRSFDYQHTLGDTVRGISNFIATDSTEASQSVLSGISGVTPTGYTLGTWAQVNQSGRNFVGWQFRRAPKFFDIVQYTGNGVSGRQIAHNLGVKPGMMIVKRVDATADWQVYHQAQGATKYGVLNSTAAFSTATNRWNNTEPTTSVFTVGSDTTVNANGGAYIAYLPAHDPSPQGLIQCGSYVGNGSAIGPIVNLGWRPQYLMVKSATVGAGSWFLIDSTRGVGNFITANSANAESVTKLFDFNANGFQPVYMDNAVNGNGQTYIYMAIREA